jgi:Family of unknown function (DUF5691)
MQKTAIVGTARAPISAEMRQKLSNFGLSDDLESTRALLILAAIESRMSRAGYIFSKNEQVETKHFLGEKWGDLGPIATRLLGQILRGSQAGALPEFLKTVVFYQKSLPPASLPKVLGLFLNKKLDFEQLGAAIGERGNWLAAQHPDWKNLLEKQTKIDIDFFTSGIEERIVFLKKTRAELPNVGLEMLKKTWPEDPFEQRAKLLPALEIGLSLADEVFLENALQDKRREVRRVAMQLSAKNEGSRVAEQLFGLAVDSIVLSQKRGDSELILDKKSPNHAVLMHFESGMNAKFMAAESTILAEIFALISPNKWENYFSEQPEILLPRFEKMGVLLPILEAIQRFENANWQLAAIRFWANEPNLSAWTNPVFGKFLLDIPTEILDLEIKNAFSDKQFLLEANAPLTNFLMQSTHFWSEEMSQAFFKHLYYWLERTSELAWNGWFLEDLMRKISWQAAPKTADFVAEMWKTMPRYSPISPRTMEQVGAIFSFRTRMISAISEGK